MQAKISSGSFAPVAVASVSFFMAFFDRLKGRQYLTKARFASLCSAFTLSLILGQRLTTRSAQSFEFSSFLTTFLKVLAWPASNSTWPAFVFIAPILLLACRISRAPENAGRLELYVFMLSAFGVMMACSRGFARSHGGLGPSDRYVKFLAVSCVASFMTLLLLLGQGLKWGPKTNGILVLA